MTDTITELPRLHAVDPPDPKDARREPATADETAERWRPTRAGIINVWRYYDETFHFHAGRLLLNGPNGSGKSKALELLLPYLFDANLHARRLSTFGGNERTMHWNLMGDGYAGTNRVGYVWLEFDRGHGDEQLSFTCGARLQASTNTTTVATTYFTTELRVGLPGGLNLINKAGRPLTRQDLAAAIGERGDIHEAAGDYRRTVRQTLFPGFTTQKYDALITALLQLRTPKLSEHLDPGVLSTLLSRALPPLDRGDITEIAEGFERLDRQREELKRLDDEVTSAETLATRQRTYARRILRAGAARLISATSTMDRLTRTARESQEAYERTQAELGTITQRDMDLEVEANQHLTRIDTLTHLDAYTEGRELDKLRTDLGTARAHVREEGERASKLDAQAGAAEEEARGAAERAALAEQAADRSRADAERAARRPGLTAAFEELDTTTDPALARRLLRAAVSSRNTQLGEVRSAIGDHGHAVNQRKEAEQRLEAARDNLAVAETAASEAQGSYRTALSQLTDDLVDWATDCVELNIDADAVAQAAPVETGVVELVNAAAGRVSDAITRDETTEQFRRNSLVSERNDRVAERAELEDKTEVAPPPPHTRDVDRSTMSGAPLWRLVSFQHHVDASTQAGIEAALETSGLLDAWVLPDGQLSVPGYDTFAEPNLGVPVDGPTLAEVLTCEHDAPVPGERVNRLLACVAYGPTAPEHVAAVGADGSWRLAATHGRWTKAEPEYVGAAARERARLRFIAELTAQIETLEGQIGQVDETLRQLARRRQALTDELGRRPDYLHLNAAGNALQTAEAALGAQRDAGRRAEGDVAAWESKVSAALRALTTTAARHGLPTRPDALDEVQDALESLLAQGGEWLSARQEATTCREQARNLAGTAARTRSLADDLAASATRRRREADEIAERLSAIEDSVGAEYRQLIEQIGELRARRGQIDTQRNDLRAKDQDLRTRLGALETTRRKAINDRDEAVIDRDAAATRFRHLCGIHLVADARIELDLVAPESTRGVLDSARRVAEALAATPYEPRDLRTAEARVSDQLHVFQETLATRADLSFDLDEDIRILTANVGGIRGGMAQLADVTRAERDQARTHLTDAERDLFDRTLTGDTRRQLAARIRQAKELVDTMNQHLARVRTASKVRVNLDWRVDPQLPAGTREARDLLLRDPARLGEAEREALHLFFRERVDEARAEETAASWEQQLLDVLDYTKWHQFVANIDRDDDQGWRPVTKRLHGALSGGEKAIVLHLPLFAAVAAHYQSTPLAPRVILLDEVFVGVDKVNRGQLLELLSVFDLDLMLTSDHEWCTYAELDGIAIHLLITGTDGDDAVTTARFTWDGHRLLPADDDAHAVDGENTDTRDDHHAS